MTKPPANGARLKLALFGGFLVFWVIAICGRLIFLQVLQYGQFEQKAARQQQRSIDVSPARGVIYDRNGQELAMSVQVDSVFAVPAEIPDPAMAARLLAPILNLEPNDLMARIAGAHAFTWLARKVDTATADRIRSLSLRGIYFQKEPKRFYPKNDLAAQVLGFVGLDDEGLGGLERAYDSRLRGRDGKMLISMDARHRWLGRVERKPEPGENLVLTIDEKIQYIAERELDAEMKLTHAEAATVVISNPRTGEILALANRPTFNPNDLHGSEVKSLKNHAVSDIYEPGSTFKMVTLAAALDQKLTTPDELFDCQMGSIVVGGRTIHDWKPYGVLSVSGILARSSDVGAIKVALRLGEERFDRYIRAFGFGAPTGIELPGETRGLTKPVSRWSKVSIGAISMGQEIGVSPLQLENMTNAIANDGVLVPAHIVAGAVASQGGFQTVAFHPGQGRRVIEPLTAAQMKQMLEGVVLNGTGKKAILDGYTSAGKTGTAQKINPATHTYDRVKHIASFSGFAPVNNPAISVTVIVDSPVGAHHGGDIGAPLFARIAQPVLEYLNVAHDIDVRNPQRMQLRASAKPEELQEGSADQFGDMAIEVADATTAPTPATPAEARAVPVSLYSGSAATAAASSAPPPALASAESSPRDTAAKPTASANGTVVLDVDSGPAVPSFLGKPVRAVIEQAQQAGLDVDIVGSGVARTQLPLPGSHLSSGAHVVVRFSR